jgi:hypothetical protein
VCGDDVPRGVNGFVIEKRALGRGAFAVADCAAFVENAHDDDAAIGRHTETRLERMTQGQSYFSEFDLFKAHVFNCDTDVVTGLLDW